MSPPKRTLPMNVAFGIGTRPKPTITPTKAADLFRRMDLKTVASAKTSLKTLKVNKGHIAGLMTKAQEASSAKACMLARAVIGRKTTKKQGVEEFRALLHWGKDGGSKQRRTICTAFKQSRMNLIMVHGMSGMVKKDARTYMKDYFAAGGDMRSVAQWLQLAGHVLAQQPERPGVDGFVVDAAKAVGDALSDAVDAVAGAVSSVVDAVISAGKSLASVISDVINWTASKISDFVRALIQAGKSVAYILAEAAKKGLKALKKFVKALLAVGKSVSQILTWALSQAAGTLKNVMTALIDAGTAVANILGRIANKTAALIKKAVKAILDAGKSIAHIVNEALKKATLVVEKTIKALVQLGKTVKQIIVTIGTQAINLAVKILQALMKAGKTVATILRGALSLTGGSIVMAYRSVRKVVEGLLKLGKSVANILGEAIKQGVNAVQRITQVLAQLGKSLSQILKQVASKATSIIKAAVKGLVRAGKKVAQIMSSAVALAARVLKAVVQALYEAVKKVGEILVSVATRAASVIRTVLEGLFAVGVSLITAVVSICNDVAAGFRKGFFQGLLAIGKGVVDIFKAALKAGGAILGLAFAAFMEIWGGHRGLTAAEKQEARRVFGWSIDLNRVKVAVASIPADVVNWLNGQRPFTTMYVINFSSKADITMSTMIHELTHVWQGVVAGPVYMVEALHAQLFGEGYVVTDAALQENNGDFSKFNREQQAVIVERYWSRRWGPEQGTDYSLYTRYARQVYTAKRGVMRFGALVPSIALKVKPRRIALVTARVPR